MKHRKLVVILMLMLTILIGTLAACDPKTKYDNEKTPLILSTGELDGVFSPFFSTSAYDSGIVGMTQLGMISIDKKGNPDYGDDVSSAVRYISEETTKPADLDESDDSKREDYYTTYKFVVKEGVKFADGKALTYEDILFNIYLYLDPVYTGSNTLYSTDIIGLDEYRTQNKSSSASEYDNAVYAEAEERQKDFLKFYESGRNPDNTSLEDLESDLEYLKEEFKQELNSDWSAFAGSLESYIDQYTSIAPGNKKHVTETWQAFLVGWGTVTVTKDDNRQYSDDPNKIVSVDYDAKTIADIDKIKADNKKKSDVELDNALKKYCVDKVFANYINASGKPVTAKVEQFIHGTMTGGNYTRYLAGKIKQAELGGDGSALAVPTVRGITAYKIAKDAEFVDNIMGNILGTDGKGLVDENGNKIGTTHKMDKDHMVVEVKIYGVDPKAILNFSFSVAPRHHYSNPTGTEFANKGYEVFDYANNKFGLPYANQDYMNKVVKNVQGLPLGAGVYMPSNRNSEEDFSKVKGLGANIGFFDSNIVYYVRNPYFYTTASNPLKVHNAKIKYLRYAVTNTTRLLEAVTTKTVHFADPTASNENMTLLETNTKLEVITEMTNGYGYIGINAKYVPNIHVRRAIMYAMNTQLALEFYPTNLVDPIFRPLSRVSWAYPDKISSPKYNNWSGIKFDKATAKAAILAELAQTNGEYGPTTNNMKYTFTIAGGSDDHPAYRTMQTAADLLNECGFEVKLSTDPFALRKLSTGSLTVWAAAWSAAIDPDMYQIYHKDSNATSVLAWGYPHIKKDGSNDEKEILEELSLLIDKGRRTTVQKDRIETYHKALDLVMDLAVELPVYQRRDLTVFMPSIIDETSIVPKERRSTYYGALAEIWSVSFVDQD